MPPPSSLQKLRQPGQPLLSRTQDATAAVLNPLAEAVGATPIMGAPPPPWILPDIVNGYAQAAAPQPLCAFHADALGYVHAKISLTHAAGAAAGTAALVFPKGARPSETLTLSGNDAAGAAVAMTLDGSGNFSNLAVLAAAATVRLVFSFLAEQ